MPNYGELHGLKRQVGPGPSTADKARGNHKMPYQRGRGISFILSITVMCRAPSFSVRPGTRIRASSGKIARITSSLPH